MSPLSCLKVTGCWKMGVFHVGVRCVVHSRADKSEKGTEM